MSKLRILYNPSGRAGEYADKGYACNLYSGCPHGCRYCYQCHGNRFMTPERFRQVRPVKDGLKRLERDLAKIGKVDEPIFFSFTCDPYPMGIECKERLMPEAIRLVHESGNRVRILTKNGDTPRLDLLRFQPGDEIGITMTSRGYQDALTWEPEASRPHVRFGLLLAARERGIGTWVSLEPVIQPHETLALIEMAIAFGIGTIKVGKANHIGSWEYPNDWWRQRVASIDWTEFADRAAAALARSATDYFIKADLARHITQPTGNLCRSCLQRPGVERTDSGLDCGIHCDRCWDKMVGECRERSW